METVINDYISRELVQDPALLPLANDDTAAGQRHPRLAEPAQAGGLPGGAVRDHGGRRRPAPGELRQRERHLRLPPRPGAGKAGRPRVGDSRAVRATAAQRRRRGLLGGSRAGAGPPARPPSATASRAGAATGCSGARPGSAPRLARNLQLVLGNELSAAAAQQVTRDWFRFASCEAVDVKRLRRGRAALAAAGRDPWPGTPGGRAGRGQGSHPLQRPLRLLRQWLLDAGRQRLPGHHHRTLAAQVLRAGRQPPSGGSGSWSTPGRCGATGSGRTSSHGLAGFRSRCRRPPRCAPTRW